MRYWDENLLQGPPADPLPPVVGITVHLTFAQRAYELADWYRARGAIVVLGGLHVLSCPDEADRTPTPSWSATASNSGRQVLRDVEPGTLRSRLCSHVSNVRIEIDPPPRRDLLPRDSFLTTTSLIATRGCHNRCGFCYLATDGLHMPYHMRDVGAGRRRIRGRRPALRRLHRQQPRLANRTTCASSAGRSRPLEKIWSAAVTIDVTDDPSLVREMALAGCTGVFIGFESLHDDNLTDARKKTPRAGRLRAARRASFTTTASR